MAMSSRLETMLMRLHAAQQRFHAGGSADELRELLATDIRWVVPGQNAIAGRYAGVEEVLRYFERRRELASQTFRMYVRDVLTGEGNHIAALTDGTAVIRGRQERWSTIGLYEFRGERLAVCWLLPLDAEQFDRIWSGDFDG
jgi:ketosteroid isomerase-like protein